MLFLKVTGYSFAVCISSRSRARAILLLVPCQLAKLKNQFLKSIHALHIVVHAVYIVLSNSTKQWAGRLEKYFRRNGLKLKLEAALLREPGPDWGSVRVEEWVFSYLVFVELDSSRAALEKEEIFPEMLRELILKDYIGRLLTFKLRFSLSSGFMLYFSVFLYPAQLSQSILEYILVQCQQKVLQESTWTKIKNKKAHELLMS